MKKIIVGIAVVASAIIAGCKPTVEQMKTTSIAIGYAAGLVANETGIDDSSRNAVINILNEVVACVPEQGQSYRDAWTPVIKAKVAELIEAGKINQEAGEIITTVATLAAEGVDYLFNVRFPEAKKYSELVSAGVSGCIEGFLSAFKPINSKSEIEYVEYDKKAYAYFKRAFK